MGVYKSEDAVEKPINYSVYSKGNVDESQGIQKYNPTLPVDLIPKNGEIIIKSDTIGLGTVTLYTVPSNKIFLLVTASLSSRSTGLATGDSEIYIDTHAQRILDVSHYTGFGGTEQCEINPSIPLQLFPGQELRLYSSNTNIGAYGQIAGYLIPIN